MSLSSHLAYTGKCEGGQVLHTITLSCKVHFILNDPSGLTTSDESFDPALPQYLYMMMYLYFNEVNRAP